MLPSVSRQTTDGLRNVKLRAAHPHTKRWPSSWLADAAASARLDPPTVVRGDLVDDLPALVHAAPSEAATVVVFHSAVLAYVDSAKRAAFARLVEGLGVHWLSNEGPAVLPVTSRDDGEGFRLVVHGRKVIAHTDPHGTWLRWTK